MTKVRVTKGYDAYAGQIAEASEMGLDAAANEVSTRIQVLISRVGIFPGFKAQNPAEASAIAAGSASVIGGGFIDPPGGHPRMRTGTLRRSVATQADQPGVRLIGMDATATYPDGTPVALVGYLHELGGEKMPARPFLRPGLSQSKHRAQDAYAKVMRWAAAKIGDTA